MITYKTMNCMECGKVIEKRAMRKYCTKCSNKLHKIRMRDVYNKDKAMFVNTLFDENKKGK